MPLTSGLTQRFSQRNSATTSLARLQRKYDTEVVLPSTLAVLALDQRTSTSPVTGAIALMLSSLIDHQLVVLDADGSAQPMRRLLNSSGSGDIVGLAASHDASLRRRRVEDFVDMESTVPLATCWLDGPGAIPPETLTSAGQKLQRRFPTVVIDVPIGCPPATITAAATLATPRHPRRRSP